MGVRGLCCAVRVRNRFIVIDPGVALGYTRHGLPPHPFQVYVGKKVKQKILNRLKNATDIIISHFHGDHIPLKNPNPYQLNLNKVRIKHNTHFWCKGIDNSSSSIMERYKDLSEIFKLNSNPPATQEEENGKMMSFSRPVLHGEPAVNLGTVMMTCIRDKNNIFVHASDMQLLDKRAISQILRWHPDIVLVSGPSLYLDKLSLELRKLAKENAIKLAEEIKTLIIDHHLLCSEEGYKWLKDIDSKTKNRVICAAEYMGSKRLMFEAWRKKLYKKMPVKKEWHKAYAKGEANTKSYRRLKNYY
ncbi:hypothetical protein ES703_77128 [subsurface metagenome]